MKTSILISCLLPLVMSVFQCDKNEISYKYTGTIIGLDYRKCACQTPTCGCCGAYIVEIDKEAYYFFNLPKESGIILDPQGKTPIPVKLNFIYDPESCGPVGHYILITEIEKI